MLEKLVSYFKETGSRRFILMVLGNICVGIGVGIFKLSMLGNDPFSGMNMAVSAKIGIAYANFQVLVNIVFFIIQVLFGRNLIGIGTIVNALGLGYIVTFVYNLCFKFVGVPSGFIEQIIILLVGMIICSFGLSLYQQSDVGVAPYDALSLIMAKRWTKLSYFWHRMITDGFCALICFLFGGIIGLGTLVTAFGFGPVIQFFDDHVTKPYLLHNTSK